MNFVNWKQILVTFFRPWSNAEYSLKLHFPVLIGYKPVAFKKAVGKTMSGKIN